MFQNHKFNHHCFADDTQAYVDVPQSQVGAVASRIQNCLEDVANGSGARRLQLNPGKTNIMWFDSCLSLSITIVIVDQQTTASTEKVRNLGADGTNTFLSSETSTPDPTAAGA